VRFAAWGIGLTGAWTLAAWLLWGASGLVAVWVFGLLATAIQLAAVAWLKPALGAPFPVLLKRWGMGMGLRFGGLVAFAVLVATDRERFPPLPSALGLVGVLIPLLFMEIRLLR
jgi:hypothetical protein